ncbi:MAG TPA: dynamin family protein, partial [Ktedonobacterales bacterium]|nr:dynamin family protein [Ktedonobacterales bacterium]
TRFPQVRVTIADPWLTSLDAEVVDTPGAGDLVEQRVALIYEVLGQSDAAVLLVSAHVPFSLTERTFLEEQVLGRHIARVLVVVSHLDAVPSEERESVLQAVRTRVGKVSPEIPVVASFPASVSSSGEAALTRVRDAITRLANHSDRRLWRSRQLAEQLTDQLTGLVELGHLALEAISASDAERATLLSRQRTAEREASLAWEKVGAELDQRAFAVEQTLRQRIGETRDDMVEQLLYDLQRSPNPKMWWEQDLPYLLHRQLIGIGRNSEALVLARVNQDMDWLRVAATRQLGGATNALVTTIDARGLRAGEAHFKQLPLRDLQRVRLFTRIGCGAATVATYLFFAPLGIAAGISSTILSEQLVNKQVEQQRQLVRRHVEAAVGAVVAGYLQQVTSRVRYLYQDVAQELQQAAESRDHSKTAVLALPDTGANRAAWEQLIAAAMGLRETIVLALGN